MTLRRQNWKTAVNGRKRLKRSTDPKGHESSDLRRFWPFLIDFISGETPPDTLRGVPPADFPFEKHTPLVKLSRSFPATPCLACHRSFFPLSYGLENFDVLGRWRSDYGNDPIDASGTMVDGTMFNGPAELRRALLERRDAFLSTIAEKLMAYSIGGKTAINRPTPASRMPAVRAALREAEAQNYSWSALIAGIVKASLDLR